MARFSIIMPTRDRPKLFADALASVRAQSFADFDICVVNDGSQPDFAADYAAILADATASLGDRLQVCALPPRRQGHGPSYALNHGVAKTKGEYVGFLDDDDVWTDADHLKHADAALSEVSATHRPVDLYYTNQTARWPDGVTDETLWLGTLASQLQAEGRRADTRGNFTITVDDLIKTPGFCHVNCSIVRRSLFDRISGLDETIRWEGDHDFFLRAIDAADIIVYRPTIVARHHVPDPARTANMTTAINAFEKRLSQLRVYDKAAIMARHPAIRSRSRVHRGFVFEKLADDLAAAGDWRSAAYYTRAALAARPSLRLLGRAISQTMRGTRQK